MEAILGGSDVIKASKIAVKPGRCILHPLALMQQLISLLHNKLTLFDNQ